jgi:Kef-type K+ transport system membrane component KefB
MWGMFLNSTQLFLKGKLFRDQNQVFRQGALGVLIGVILLILAAKLGAPVWLAAIIAGLVSGAAQPYLFKDLKYN